MGPSAYGADADAHRTEFAHMKKTFVFICKRTILAVFLLAPSTVTKAQGTDTVRSKDGITVTYTLKKTSVGDKHDWYRLDISARNDLPHDVYYSKFSASTTTPNTYSFSRVIIYNTSRLEGFGGTTIPVQGDATGMNTDRNMMLFRIGAGRRISAGVAFTVKTGQQPNVFFGLDGPFQKLEAFKLVMSSEPVSAATWISSCGNVPMDLQQVTQPGGRIELRQRVNGRDQVWVSNAQGIFEKPGDAAARVSWNSLGNVYTYTNDDGVVCLWQKKP